jgi:hypothetical protein
MQELLRLRDEGKLDSIQSLWFRKTKDEEELYDCMSDPHEVNNLVKDTAYNEKLKELRTEMDRWLKNIGDIPNLPEKELIAQLWNGAKTQPITSAPNITSSNNKITLECATDGASIGYKIIDKDGTTPKVWSVYQKPFNILKGSKVIAQAYRIGFVPSEIVESSTE